jgi:hypothetical protein
MFTFVLFGDRETEGRGGRVCGREMEDRGWVVMSLVFLSGLHL